MCKYISIWIHSRFISRFIRLRFCKHNSILVCDIASDYLLCKIILSFIVWVVHNFLCTHKIKINKISHQRKEQQYKNIRNSSEFFVSGLLRILFCSFWTFFPFHFLLLSLFLLFLILFFQLHLL